MSTFTYGTSVLKSNVEIRTFTEILLILLLSNFTLSSTGYRIQVLLSPLIDSNIKCSFTSNSNSYYQKV